MPAVITLFIAIHETINILIVLQHHLPSSSELGVGQKRHRSESEKMPKAQTANGMTPLKLMQHRGGCSRSGPHEASHDTGLL